MYNYLKLTSHAIQRYSIRTGTPILQASLALLKSLNEGKYIDIYTACSIFSITRIEKGDRYIIWFNEIIQENMLAIVKKNGSVVTVLTEKMCGIKNSRPINRQYIVSNGEIVKEDGWLVKEKIGYN